MGESSSKLLQNIYITQCVASKNIEVHQTSRMKAKKSDKYFSKSTRLDLFLFAQNLFTVSLTPFVSYKSL